MTNNIQIDCIRIAGFRGIQNMETALSRITVLIGPNNSGKTSVLKALHLALGNYSQYISEEDFFIGSGDNQTREIIIDIRFIPIKDGQRSKDFDDKWINEFGDKIKQEINGNAFVAIRTQIRPDEVKGGFECLRYIMQKWSDFSTWQDEKMREKDRIRYRIPSVSFIPIEAQRDIYHELRDKTSYAGRILSNVKYNQEDVEQIEEQIQNINQKAVEKSETLDDFKKHLQKLNKAFQEKGYVEISPFPKKIRDLAKHFSIHFGDKNTGMFSMEYHGMGTRSWASLLTVKAFIESLANKYEKEYEPFFPIFSAEEPEAHLHPNAQKTLCHQITDTVGQVVISTHSPYFVSSSDISCIRVLIKTDAGIKTKDISTKLKPKELKKINREIISRRGDILFSRSWILCEGITEEQIIPALFEIWKQKTLFDFGISCIGVNGKNYNHFLKLAYNMGIPVYIISDNDTKNNNSTKEEVLSQVNEIKEEIEKNFCDIFFLSKGNNFEDELLEKADLKEEIGQALIRGVDTDNENYIRKKLNETKEWTTQTIKEKIKNSKAYYSSFLADVIRENPNKKDPKKMIPKSILKCFNKIKEDL